MPAQNLGIPKAHWENVIIKQNDNSFWQDPGQEKLNCVSITILKVTNLLNIMI